MAFTSWRTWVAGAVVTAAQLNQDVRDNLNAWFPLASGSGVAWTAYTPTLTQSGTVTKTVTEARYTQVGKQVTVRVFLTVTGTGTGANAVTVSLPVTAASVVTSDVGTGHIYDTSAALMYTACVRKASTTTVNFWGTTTANSALGTANFTAALAVGDEVSFGIEYEAA